MRKPPPPNGSRDRLQQPHYPKRVSATLEDGRLLNFSEKSAFFPPELNGIILHLIYTVNYSFFFLRTDIDCILFLWCTTGMMWMTVSKSRKEKKKPSNQENQ